MSERYDVEVDISGEARLLRGHAVIASGAEVGDRVNDLAAENERLTRERDEAVRHLRDIIDDISSEDHEVHDWSQKVVTDRASAFLARLDGEGAADAE